MGNVFPSEIVGYRYQRLCIPSIHLSHFLVTFQLFAIMLNFFLSHLETSHHMFVPFVSLPTIILNMFCYPFPPTLINPTVVKKKYTVKIIIFLFNFSPLFFFLLIFFYFIFSPNFSTGT